MEEPACTEKTCRRKNLYLIPEKTILDEVCLHKTLYCSGTQQNLQAHPEQRNVGIQQIFHNLPEYVERNNEPHVSYRPYAKNAKRNDEDINEVSLGRFYLPTKAQCPPAVCSCKCATCSQNKIDERKKILCGDTATSTTKLCPFRSTTVTSTYKEPSSRPKQYQAEKPRTIGKKSVHYVPVPIIEEDHISEKPQIVKTNVRPQTSPKLQQKETSEKPEKKTKPQKHQATGLVRNSAFWRDTDSEDPENAPEEIIRIVHNEPHSEPVIRKKSKAPPVRNYQSEVPMSPINALDHESFHSVVPPIVIEPPKERTVSVAEEALMRRSRRQSRALTIQKSCLLRKTLNLDGSSTRLIYPTHISDTSSPFRSKSFERHSARNYESSRNTSTTLGRIDNSDTIIVVPETCRRNIVDSPKSVSFSRNTRCRTVEDIDARCRTLLRLNFSDADADDEF